MNRSAAAGHLSMFGFAAVVSGSFGLGGLAARHLDPAAFTLARMIIAAVAIGVLVAVGPGFRPAYYARGTWRYPVLGFFMSLYFVLMFEALRITDPVSTGAVFTLAPALSAIFGWLLLRQVTTRLNAAMLALGAAGAVWVIFKADLSALLGFRVGPGERLFFIGVASHAFYAPLVRRLNRGEPVVAFTFGTIVGAIPLLAVWAGPEALRTDWTALPGVVWLAILYTALGATAGTFLMLQFAAMRLPAGKVMAYTYLTPAFVILWEGALGHGWPDPGVWAGAAVAVLALALLAWR